MLIGSEGAKGSEWVSTRVLPYGKIGHTGVITVLFRTVTLVQTQHLPTYRPPQLQPLSIPSLTLTLFSRLSQRD